LLQWQCWHLSLLCVCLFFVFFLFFSFFLLPLFCSFIFFFYFFFFSFFLFLLPLPGLLTECVKAGSWLMIARRKVDAGMSTGVVMSAMLV